MFKQAGFTLFELMIAIAVIAILSAIGIPAYQGYIQKAAMTDMLQVMTPYKTAIELCALEQGKLQGCSSGSQNIATSRATRYVSSITVNNGNMTLIGQAALDGLTVTLMPMMVSGTGELTWQRKCSAANNAENLLQGCKDVFRFTEQESE